jgi:hypothetical protein
MCERHSSVRVLGGTDHVQVGAVFLGADLGDRVRIAHSAVREPHQAGGAGQGVGHVVPFFVLVVVRSTAQPGGGGWQAQHRQPGPMAEGWTGCHQTADRQHQHAKPEPSSASAGGAGAGGMAATSASASRIRTSKQTAT